MRGGERWIKVLERGTTLHQDVRTPIGLGKVDNRKGNGGEGAKGEVERGAAGNLSKGSPS